jgi:hypothetical protein
MALSDRLITLAHEADNAGYPMTDEHLVRLAIPVLTRRPPDRGARARE